MVMDASIIITTNAIDIIMEIHNWQKYKKSNCVVSIPIYLEQPLHLRLREIHRREGRMIVRTWRPRSLTVDSIPYI